MPTPTENVFTESSIVIPGEKFDSVVEVVVIQVNAPEDADVDVKDIVIVECVKRKSVTMSSIVVAALSTVGLLPLRV